MKFIYKPAFLSLIIDFLILIIGIFVVLEWFPLTTRTPYDKYADGALFYYGIWVLISYILGRYKPLHLLKYKIVSFNLIYTTLLTFFIVSFVSFALFKGHYSIYVVFTFTTIIYAVFSAFYLLYFVLLYAVEYDEIPIEIEVRENAVLLPPISLDDESFNDLKETICTFSGKKCFDVLSHHYDLKSGAVYVNLSSNYLDIKAKRNYKYSTFINLERLNNMRGINNLFNVLNQKLPDDGQIVCCFESKSTRKKNILKSLPKGINYIYYSFNYVYRRIIPKLFLTRRLYYDITHGKNRILSKAEVMGRLYFSGFEVINDCKVGSLTYVFARRVKQPEPIVKKSYGPLIKLKRLGKNGKVFDVYKMRTMHPYSEYLQAYIYDHYNLQKGGKFNNDIRINTLGRIMRKYFLDEIPMLLNLIRGEMKIVGVRPISNHYFSLYSAELQEKRLKTKPGLLPPFYADMPETMEEIQNSEMKYLIECEKNGTFVTDVKYLRKIIKNIIINKARSA